MKCCTPSTAPVWPLESFEGMASLGKGMAQCEGAFAISPQRFRLSDCLFMLKVT